MSKNPLSGFAPKQTIESSALTAQPHSATFVLLKLKKQLKVEFVVTISYSLTLLLVDNYFNTCRVNKLFSENLQNRGYVQLSQIIIYKK